MNLKARKKAVRKHLFHIAIMTIIIVILILLDRKSLTGGMDHKDLKIVKTFSVPIIELSGLSKVPSSKPTTFLGVGDSNAQFALIKVKENSISTELIDLQDPILAKYSICRKATLGSCYKFNKSLLKDWEAASADKKSLFAVLQEFSSSVLFIDGNHLKPISRVHLDFSTITTKTSKRHQKLAENTMGEGLLLLKNGHLIIAKEKYPAAIIEFGPAGNKPLGISTKTLLGDNSFKIPKEDANYEPLHIWQMDKKSKCDISDLEANSKGDLYILSENCRRITIKTKGLAVNTFKIDTIKALSIPKKIINPEAIALFEDKIFIGSDIKSKKSNLFLVSPTKK